MGSEVIGAVWAEVFGDSVAAAGCTLELDHGFEREDQGEEQREEAREIAILLLDDGARGGEDGEEVGVGWGG